MEDGLKIMEALYIKNWWVVLYERSLIMEGSLIMGFKVSRRATSMLLHESLK